VRRLPAPAKINLALVVGPRRADGRHEVVTVLQRIDLADRVTIEVAGSLSVSGFAADTIVRRALEALAAAAGVEPRWRARIQKRIPVASGLGGGSSDAATALALANRTLPDPLGPEDLHELAADLGADVPFFLRHGPALATGTGTELSDVELPQDFWVVLVLPRDAAKRSTADIYEAFDARDGAEGFEERRGALLSGLAEVRRARHLATLPRNDLASSPVSDELVARGAFRADVTGAGPAVYGLFTQRARAEHAARELRTLGRVWVTVPAWYG
jgi:4-diphosphocytidyl-2-C-methyl-D-erythritol kinase